SEGSELRFVPQRRGGPVDPGGAAPDGTGQAARAVPRAPPGPGGGPAGRFSLERRPVLGDLQAARQRAELSISGPLPLPSGAAGLGRRPARREEVGMPGPLDGVLVLDLSRVLAGPFCTMLLADLGARIVKVEHPVDGDVTRSWGPPYEPRSGMAAYYLAVNRNKESIALDLVSEEGRRSVETIASRADVVVENFAPGALERLGISLAALREASPRLVTASITGFGRSGPDASSPGFDLLAQAGAG